MDLIIVAAGLFTFALVLKITYEVGYNDGDLDARVDLAAKQRHLPREAYER